MIDNDQAAVEALADILCGDPEVATTYQDDARAILDAIRAGKVPGVFFGEFCNAQLHANADLRARAERAERERDEARQQAMDLQFERGQMRCQRDEARQERDEVRAESAQRKERLEQAMALLRMDQPYPLYLILEQAAEALGHLLDHHNCDCHGHEIRRTVQHACESAAKDVRAFLAGQPAPVVRPLVMGIIADVEAAIDQIKPARRYLRVRGRTLEESDDLEHGPWTPVWPEVDDAMVERACRVRYGESWWDSHLPEYEGDLTRYRTNMRAVLVAALGGGK